MNAKFSEKVVPFDYGAYCDTSVDTLAASLPVTSDDRRIFHLFLTNEWAFEQ
jgi:hypothetical protein